MKQDKKRNRPSMFWNKYTKWIMIWTLAGLILRASSTFWVSELLNGGLNVFLSLGFLMGSYLLSTVPDTMIFAGMEKAEFEASKIYTEQFIDSHQNSPELMLDSKFRKRQEPLLTSQSRGVFKDAYALLYSGTLSTSAILVDAITMSSIVDYWYAAAYGGSILIYMGIMKYINPRVAKYASKSLEEAKPLTSTLLTGWDNIVIDNRYNMKLWLTNFNNTYSASKETALRYVKYLRKTGSLGTFIACSPILGTTIFLFSQYSADVTKIALLLAVLPRQLQTVQFFNMFSSFSLRWSGTSKQLKDLNFSVEEIFSTPRNTPVYRVFWKKLNFSCSNRPIKFDSVSMFLDSVSNMKNGRITIRGENGFGKSVLMCRLKRHLIKQGKAAFHLPTNVQLSFAHSIDEMSSGEKLKSKIREIAENTDEPFILLDEWDANLDSENISRISKHLDELAKKRCVVEIRHRQDSNARENERFSDKSYVSRANLRSILSDNKKEVEHYEFDVPADGACLFYSIMFAYLIPVANDQKIFIERMVSLFGKAMLPLAEQHRKLFVDYDGSSEFIQEHQSLEILANVHLRRHLVDYMKRNHEEFIEDNEAFLARMESMENRDLVEWGDQPEIEALSKLLAVRITVYQPGEKGLAPMYGKDYGIYFDLQLCLVRTPVDIEGVEDQNSPRINHYHFLIPKEHMVNKKLQEEAQSEHDVKHENERNQTLKELFSAIESGEVEKVNAIIDQHKFSYNAVHPEDKKVQLLDVALRVENSEKRIKIVNLLMEKTARFHDKTAISEVGNEIERPLFFSFRKSQNIQKVNLPDSHDELEKIVIEMKDNISSPLVKKEKGMTN